MARFLAFALLLLLASSTGCLAANIETSNDNVGFDVKNELKQIFQKWMVEYNKVYDSLEDFETRFKIFEENHMKIALHNMKKNESFSMKVRLSKIMKV